MAATKLELKASTNIAEAHFDAEAEEVVIKFKNNATAYVYRNFRVDDARAWLEAESSGKHFAANIRGKFPWVKLEQAAPVPES